MNDLDVIDAAPDVDPSTEVVVNTGISVAAKDLYWPGERRTIMGQEIDELMVHAHQLGASNIHIRPDVQAKIRLYGRHLPITRRRLTEEEVKSALMHIYGPKGSSWLLSGQDFTKGHTVKIMPEDAARFTFGDRRALTGALEGRYRYRWHGAGIKHFGNSSVRLTARCIPNVPPTPQQLGLEDGLLANYRHAHGLVLVTGATSQGKTTMLAALTREMLEDPDANLNILEFASPPEYEYDMIEGPTSLYAVSDIPDNYKTGRMAIRGAMHSAPNVIMAPEARDGEMMALSLEACLTGHLTFTTVQTSDVASTIQRVQVMFPKEEREERSIAMMQNLRLIVSCRLIRSANGKEIQLREFLPFGEQTRRELLSQPLNDWPMLCEEYLAAGRGQTFAKAAQLALNEGRITRETAKEFLNSY